jgi:hypothetical protein
MPALHDATTRGEHEVVKEFRNVAVRLVDGQQDEFFLATGAKLLQGHMIMLCRCPNLTSEHLIRRCTKAEW